MKIRPGDWRTPPEVWNPLQAEFQFDLDAAADQGNTLVSKYLDDALSCVDWPGKRIFCNPPYGNALASFVRKCAAEAEKGKLVVALIPMRTRASWWHEAVLGKAAEVRCIRKRVQFLHPDGTRGRFTLSCDSCLVVWRGKSLFWRGHPLDKTRIVGWKQEGKV